jgi:hypothetical protein
MNTNGGRTIASALSQGGVVGAIVALLISIGTLFLNALQWRETSLQSRIDRVVHENDLFIKLISQINGKETSAPQRMTFLWSLRPYWHTEHAETVANALSAIILYDDNERVIEVCADVFDGAYRHVKNQEQKARIKKLLYGDSKGDIGVIQRTQQILREPDFPKGDGLYQVRLNATKTAVRRNWNDLRDINLEYMDLSHCELYKAELARSDLRKANLTDADLKGRLMNTKVEGALITNANLKGARGTHFVNCNGTPVYQSLKDWRNSHPNIGR